MDFKAYIAAAAVAFSPVAASAASVDINFQVFGSGGGASDINDATAALNAFIGGQRIIGEETFDGFTACPNTNCDSSPSSTSVGDFSGIVPADAGEDGSQVAPYDQVVIRSSSPNPFGRFNVVGDEHKWLDSNDMNGIKWEIPGASDLSNITRIAFFLMDVNDVGSVAFTINASGDDISDQTVTGVPANSGRPDGELLLVTMNFSQAVNLIDIEMTTGKGDGFGMDGITVATVPLPAAGLLLLGALGGLAALRRRRRAA